MAWWDWTLIAWSASASVMVLWLTAVCARKRVGARAAYGHDTQLSELLRSADEPLQWTQSTGSGLTAVQAETVPPAVAPPEHPHIEPPPPSSPSTQPLSPRP